MMSYNTTKKIALAVILTLGITACDTVNYLVNPRKSSYKSNVLASNNSNKNGVSRIMISHFDHGPAIISKVTNYGDLWSRVRDDFQLSIPRGQPKIRDQVQWYMRHQEYLYHMTQQASPYMYLIYKEIRKRNMPMELVLLPIIESEYYPFSYSDAGAVGLWQLMPGTASKLGLRHTAWYDGRRDLFESTKAALNYLNYLQNCYNGDWLLAIAAYDAGEGTVNKAIRHNERLGLRTDFWSLPLPRETHAYIPRLLALADIVRNHGDYNIDLPEIQDHAYLAEVDVGSQMKLADAAKLAGVSLKDLRKYNAGYTRMSTVPKGPSKLLIPVDKVKDFKEKIAELPHYDQISWEPYKIKRDETLDLIAQHHNTTTDALRHRNHLKNDTIKAGKTLLVPVLSRYISMQPVHKKSTVAAAPPHKSITTVLRLPHTTDTPSPHGVHIYHVRTGDSLVLIAKRFGVKTTQLIRWNPSIDPPYLMPGQKITVYT